MLLVLTIYNKFKRLAQSTLDVLPKTTSNVIIRCHEICYLLFESDRPQRDIFLTTKASIVWSLIYTAITYRMTSALWPLTTDVRMTRSVRVGQRNKGNFPYYDHDGIRKPRADGWLSFAKVSNNSGREWAVFLDGSRWVSSASLWHIVAATRRADWFQRCDANR